MGEPMAFTESDTVFAEATDEQRELLWTLRSEAPAGSPEADAFAARERFLHSQPLNDGITRCWVIFLKGYPRQIMSSCEGTLKPIIMTGRGECAGYVISNLWTNSQYRRQGLASQLLLRVQALIDEEGIAVLSMLHSNSGRTYYSGLGWSAYPSKQATLKLVSSSAPSSPVLATRSIGTPTPDPRSFVSVPRTSMFPLLKEHVPNLCDIDIKALRWRFSNEQSRVRRPLSSPTRTTFAFVPTAEQVMFQLERSEYDGKVCWRNSEDAEDSEDTVALLKGCVYGSAFIIWAHDWKEKRLRVLRIGHTVMNIQYPSTLSNEVFAVRVLLEAALQEASEWGFHRVVVWNPDELTDLGCKAVSNAHQGEVRIIWDEQMEGITPAVRWTGPGVGCTFLEPTSPFWDQNQGYCLS